MSRHLAVIVSVAIAMFGCAKPEPIVEEVASHEVHAERGPVRAVLRVEPDMPTAGEPVRLMIEVIAEEGVIVRMPDFGETIGAFEVVRGRTPPDVPLTGKRKWVHEYDLLTFEAGPHEIEDVSIAFVDERDAERLVDGQITFDPIIVDVDTLLTSDATEADLRDIKSPAVIDVPGLPAWVWPVVVSGGVLALAALAGGLLVSRRRPAAMEAVVVEPHIWASQALDDLEAQAFLDRGEQHAFYVELSGIVREYLERQFGLLAPEQTTDEFLRDASRSSSLSDEHKAILANFLRAADMVKFALHVPPPEDGRAALDEARAFVKQTSPAATREAAA